MAAFLRSYGWLLIVTAIVAVFQSLYVIAGVTPSMYAQLIASSTLPICFATWVQADARIRRCTPFFDFGTFVLVFWSLAIPSYLIWTNETAKERNRKSAKRNRKSETAKGPAKVPVT